MGGGGGVEYCMVRIKYTHENIFKRTMSEKQEQLLREKLHTV
jgi:hypothetical protein